MMGLIFGIFEWWQLPLIVLLIVLLVAWKMYRKKQM
jgi:hypothetical protein